LRALDYRGPNLSKQIMQAIHVFARTGSQAKMVQANPALREAVAVMRRTGWLHTDRCPSADAIEQLVSIADRRHAQGEQKPAVESPRRRKLTHGQHDMRHAVDPDRGVSCGHGHPSLAAIGSSPLPPRASPLHKPGFCS
jgi:hypothetical protein